MIFWFAYWLAVYDELNRCTMRRAMPELAMVESAFELHLVGANEQG
jgi:hypothetical protein